MLTWLKNLLGLQPSPTVQLELPPIELVSGAQRGPQTVEELDAENIELGYRADRLRQQRIENRKRAAALRDGSN